MPKPVSMAWARLKASFASSYSKLWSAATPQRKWGCASADADVGNTIAPKPQAGRAGAFNAQRRQAAAAARSHLIDRELAHVEEQIEPPRADRRIADPAQGVITTGRSRPRQQSTQDTQGT